MFGFRKREPKPSSSTSGEVIAAATTASIMVALYDGEFTPAQKDRLIETVSAYKQGFSTPAEILEMVEQHVSLVRNTDREKWPGALASTSRHLSRDAKILILHAAGNMALLGNQMGEAEQRFLADTAWWIGIDETGMRQWMEEFKETMSDAVTAGIVNLGS